MKHILRFIMIFCCVLFGQNKDSWINELPVVERMACIDTLAGLNHESSGKEIASPKKRFVRVVASAATILLGAAAWRTQMESDKYYDKYLYTGDPVQRQDAWNKTKKLDQVSGMMVVGSQLFMQLLIYSYVENE
tara:strand:- start:313 stop:714 length:402 start_codon:yes stop_codon:yes gene_type:complete